MARFEPLEARRLLANDYFPFSQAQIQLDIDGQQEQVDLTGPTFVTRTDPGDTVPPAGNGRDDSVTQIHQLQLEGDTANFGPIIITLNPNVPSTGFVEEQDNTIPDQLETPATAQFGLFVLIDLPQQDIHAQNDIFQPIILNATLNNVPPGEGETFVFNGQIPLVSQDPRNPLPVSITLDSVSHTVRPLGQQPPFVEHDVFPRTVGQVLLEVPDAPVVETPSPDLPPLEAVYMTAADVHATYTQAQLEIVLQDIRHRPFANPQPTITQVGQDEQEVFQSSLEGTAVITDPSQGLDHVEAPLFLTGPVTTLVLGKGLGERTGSWDTEILSMSLTGDISIPGGPTLTVEVTESPTRDSAGGTAVLDNGGRFQIDSFFDVFTELSIDGGPPIPSAEATTVRAFPNGIQTESPTLPPDDGEYRSASDVHAEFSGADLQIVLQDVRHRAFAVTDREIVGNDEIETFNSELLAVATISSEQSPTSFTIPITLTGPVRTRVTDKAGQTTGTFQTEILSMDLSGIVDLPGQGTTILSIREDVTLDSGGVTTIRDLPDGTFHIDSFFDVFTELSVDGGRTWAPADDFAPIHLHEEPERILVSGIGQAEIDVYFDGPIEGDAGDLDHDGTDDVLSQVVDMRLNGYIEDMGSFQIAARPDEAFPSLGRIEEQQNLTDNRLDVTSNFADQGVADSFFDIWPQISMRVDGQLQSFFTAGPTRVESVIKSKPPGSGERYVFAPPQPVPLLTAAGDVIPFRIVREVHDTTIVEHDALDPTTALLQLVGGPIGATPQAFIVSGPANVDVFFEGEREGIAFDDSGNGLDEVETELVSMNLTDGNITVRIRPSTVPPWAASMGRIEELVNNTPGELDLNPFHPGTAASYFNVFVEIELADGTVLHNQTGLRLEAIISEKPPFERYVHIIPPAGGIELYNELNQPTGVFITQADHHTGTREVDVFEHTVAQLLLELPPEPGVITPNPALPPTDGVYRTAADVHAEFQGDDLLIVLQDIRHRPFASPPPQITIVGSDEQESFESSLTGTAIITSAGLGLDGVAVPVNLTGPVQTLVRGKADTTTGTFQTEILSMDLSGDVSVGTPTGTLTLPIVVQVSPSQESQGGTQITDLGGGQFRIDSFFDVFTELSVDGGQNFIPSTSSTRVDLVQPGVRTPKPDLPPTDGVYRSAQDVHAEFQGADLEIVLQDVRHRAFAHPRPQISVAGSNEQESFQSSLTGTAIVTSDSLGLDGVAVPVELSGPVQTIVLGKAGQTTGSWDTEMISMSLTGDVPLPGGQSLPLVVRESPSQDSQGHVTVTDLGNGQFQVDSFFDVFTELSVDGGGTFIPSTDSTRVELAPPPRLVTLVGPTTVHVFFEGDEEGDARDDDGDNLDEVQTEIVAMQLTGTTPLGPVEATLRHDVRSTGEIEEQVDATTGVLDVAPFTQNAAADSFFDVWPEITVGGRVLRTAQPLHLETTIRHKPPQDGEEYVNPYLVRVELIDAVTGEGTGIFVLREIHQPDPTIEVDEFENTSAEITLINLATGAEENIRLRGPSTVHVFFEGANEGDAEDDDGDGLEEVQTEIVSMNLTGLSSLGPVVVRQRSDVASRGQIQELANNTSGLLDVDPFAPGDADSFFDVYFEIEVGGQTYITARPKRMRTTITHKPPGEGDTYFDPQIVELLDPVTLQPTGLAIGTTRHVPNPRPVPPDLVGLHRGRWFFLDVNGNNEWNGAAGGDRAFPFFRRGQAIAGDFDGDGFDEVGVHRGLWFFIDANNNGRWDRVAGGDWAFRFNQRGQAIVGDFDGDGVDEVGVHRGLWFFIDANNNGRWDKVAGGDRAFRFAQRGQAFAGDFNGDGVDEVGIHRRRWFFIDANGNGAWNKIAGGDLAFRFNQLGRAIAGDFNGDGIDEVGTHRRRWFFLDLNGNHRWDAKAGGDLAFPFHKPGEAIVGLWAPNPAQPANLVAGRSNTILSANALGTAGPQAGRLRQADVEGVLAQAVQFISAAPLSAEQLQALSSVEVRVANLSGTKLAKSNGNTITVDVNAARHGWFVDRTPGNNREFRAPSRKGLAAKPRGPAAGRMDLYTAVLHELGHVVGWEHLDARKSPNDIMADTLYAGLRRTSFADTVDRVFAGGQ